jgi:outer membrane lipoprotein SlyB
MSMRAQQVRGWSVAGATLIALTVAGCSDKTSKTASADSSLARDLALAGTPTAQPTFQDTAVAPTPVAATNTKEAPPAPVRTHTAQRPKVEAPRPVEHAPAPQPTPQVVVQAPTPTPAPIPAATPAPAPARGEIGSGSVFALTSGSKVCTNSNLPGDKLVATVNTDIAGSNGAVIPAGSAVVLEVASVAPGKTADSTQITFRVRSVVVNDKTYDASATVTPLAPLEKTKVAGDDGADKKKVIGGAIAGAILGQMIGHNTKGTIIGAAAGAATGAAVAKSGEKWEGCLPAGAPMRLTLNAPIVM